MQNVTKYPIQSSAVHITRTYPPPVPHTRPGPAGSPPP